jgi:DNA polymerase III epsilon subunit-like protein
MGKVRLLFDTETTGLLKSDSNKIEEQPYITEFYACKIDEDYNIIGEFETFIKPPIPISREITKITGISEVDLKDAPKFSEVYSDLAEFFIGVDEMIAHNLPFDRSMVANELVRVNKLINFPWPIKHICTVEMSMGIEQRRINLNTLHQYATGKDIIGAHRAKTDVMALVRGYHWLMEEAKK